VPYTGTLNSIFIANQYRMGDTPKPIEKMLVTDLRAELQKRGLETKGLKKELFDRLKAAMDAEAAGGNSDAPSNVDDQNQPEKNAENKEEQNLDVETSNNKPEQVSIRVETVPYFDKLFLPLYFVIFEDTCSKCNTIA
jgi:hypothetical protein